MPRRFFHYAFVTTFAALVPAFAIACSDNKDNGAVTTTVPQTAPATVEVSPTSKSTVAGVQAPDAQYTSYVSSLCRATATFQEGLGNLASADFARKAVVDPDGAFRDAGDVFQRYSDDLDRADAPSELDAWQADVKNRVDAVAAGLKNRDQSQFSKVFDTRLPSFPPGTEEKLRAAASGNPDCAKAKLFQ